MRPRTLRRMCFEAEAFPHLDALSRTAFWLTGNKPEADGLVCETFATAYRLWDITVSKIDFKTWLFKILTRLFCGSCRNHTRRSDFIESSDGDEVFPGVESMSAEALDDLGQRLLDEKMNGNVRAAITGLPADVRVVVILSFLEEFSYREIADIAGIDLDDVRSWLYRGRKLMQKGLFGRVAKVARTA
ncbi:MAG: RNA polymerase sigma factor [candidate division Zixibacteria bacterium]|nr:RNA polymerase sigma factor [candidate division Zixibacteria bacterium]